MPNKNKKLVFWHNYNRVINMLNFCLGLIVGANFGLILFAIFSANKSVE